MFARKFIPQPSLSRRGFLKATGGAGIGLILGASLSAAPQVKAAASGTVEFNPFVHIAPDSSVTVMVKHLDMGQGTANGLVTLVAEELDATHDQMRIDFAPADAAKYANLAFGTMQGTGGSTAIANSYMQYRTAGAAARAMLAEAAAKTWNVPVEEVVVKDGALTHASGKSAVFGEMAAAASALPVPEKPALKDASSFVFIGKSFARLDTKPKTEGAALYGLDVQREGRLVAVLARAPRFGSTVKSFDAAETKKVRGVVDVVQLPHGVAVLATGTWPALKGRDALKVEWDESKAEKRGSAELLAEYRALADKPGVKVRADGDAEAALKTAAKVVEAEFEFPYLAHAPMEPIDITVHFDGTTAEFWTGAQLPTVDQMVAGAILGIKPEQVKINTVWAGGSFGRRAIADAHYFAEAAMLAKAYGKPVPIKIVWSREDDIKGGYYRPAYLHRVKAGLDAAGNIVAWQHRVVGQSILAGTPFEAFMVKDGVDATSVEGASDMPYAIPNFHMDLHTVKVGVPVLWWRSVGHTHTAYVVETMMDDLAAAAGKDPVEFRLALLDKHPRHAAVLKLAAEKADWKVPLPAGKARGVAVHESFSSFVAEVAEIAIGEDGFKVDRVVCAVDCGIAVNPDNIKAQIEGGVGYGLGHAQKAAITLTEGVVDQSNFHDYEPMRISEMPSVEVHIVASPEAPTGVGEPGVPPIAPAVSNALLAATGKRFRILPFSRNEIGGA